MHTDRAEWDKNVQVTNVIKDCGNGLQVLHIINKGSLGVQRRDFFEKKLTFGSETKRYYYFSSMPPESEGTPPLEKDTVRAEIHLGFHKFEVTEEGVRATLLL